VVSGHGEAGRAGVAISNPQSLIPNPSPDQALFPEYLTCEDKSEEIARHLIEWLTVPAKRRERVEALAALKADVAHGGASRRAAEYILAAIGLSPVLGNFHRQQVELALEIA
jgi:lipid A disaccharide synthetase